LANADVLILDAAVKLTAWLETLAIGFNARINGINDVIGSVDLTVGVLDRASEPGCFDVGLDPGAIGGNELMALALEEASNTSVWIR